MSDEPHPVLTERQARILAEADGELSAIEPGRAVRIDNFSMRTACDALARAEKQASADHIA